jgi:pimeloyl-ACP methyl ester carboxylesterase
MTPNSAILAPSDIAAAPLDPGTGAADVDSDKTVSLLLNDGHNIMIVIQKRGGGRAMGNAGSLKPTPAQLALQMLTPHRVPRAGGLWIEEAERRWFACGGERLSALRVGDGAPVLLVHGMGGAAADFAAILPALLGAGHAVVLLDLPAHGESGGRLLTVPAAARAVLECGRRFGPLHAAVAHSLGAAALAEALKLGLQLERAVLLAPPRRYLDGVDEAARLWNYDAGERDALIAELLKHGVDAAALDLPHTVAALTTPALIVHSDDDALLPITAGQSVAAAWRDNRFVGVSGLGHRRILRDAAVVDEIVRFVGAGVASPAALQSSGSSGSTYLAGGLPS